MISEGSFFREAASGDGEPYSTTFGPKMREDFREDHTKILSEHVEAASL